MFKGHDEPAFDAAIRELCVAFNRPHTDELTRVVWDALKNYPLPDIRRMAIEHRNTAKKFPTPKDITPDRVTAPPAPPKSEPAISSWAIAANKILFAVAYLDQRRGFKPIADYPPPPEHGYGLPLTLASHPRPLNDKLQVVLAAKSDFVRMAEEAEARGDQWEPQEFNRMCREGFQKLLGMTATV